MVKNLLVRGRTYILTSLAVLMLMLTMGIGYASAHVATPTKAAHVATHKVADPPDFLKIAPGNLPKLFNGGLSAKMNVRYACASSSAFIEGSAKITVVLTQGPNAMTGTANAECDGLVHNFPSQGFVVTGPIALHPGAAQVVGILQQLEVGTTFGNNGNNDNTESNGLAQSPHAVTLIP